MLAIRLPELLVLVTIAGMILSLYYYPEVALAKRIAMGLPSLSVSLYLDLDSVASDTRMQQDGGGSIVIESLKADIDKANRIIENIILPEIKKEFVGERKGIYLNNYAEGVGGYYDIKGSTLTILINKVPPDYGCSTEGCAHRTISVDIPEDLEPHYIKQIGVGIAVTENMGHEGEYDMFVERILAKASNEARLLSSEAANVLEENREKLLLEDDAAIEILLLRQYEDISRVSVLFASLDSDASCAYFCEKPLDVVITTNSNYERLWNASSSTPLEQQQSTITEGMLLECERIGISEQDCSDVATMQSRSKQALLSEQEVEIIEDAQRDITDSMYMVGIGAAIAGVAALVTMWKIK